MIVGQNSLTYLLNAISELVVERAIIYTAFDGDPLELTIEELEQGWKQIGGVAISPLLSSPNDLPLDGNDIELYVYPQPISFDTEIEIFVDDSELDLRNIAEIEQALDQNIDRGYLELRFISYLFLIHDYCLKCLRHLAY